MYDIKLGQGCGIKATMLTPAGGVCDLRRARYIAASLVLVSGSTMYVFLNCQREISTIRTYVLASVGTGALGLVIVFVMIYFFSGDRKSVV